MSTVSDAGNLVQEGENGFLFSPHDPSDIAEAIAKLPSLTEAERVALGQYFDIRKIADLYASILWAASRRAASYMRILAA
jgi:glycosyltransferase involved in cell wall biosynthesis